MRDDKDKANNELGNGLKGRQVTMISIGFAPNGNVAIVAGLRRAR
jgi:L-asparagine transporter-like permease